MEGFTGRMSVMCSWMPSPQVDSPNALPIFQLCLHGFERVIKESCVFMMTGLHLANFEPVLFAKESRIVLARMLPYGNGDSW